MNATFVELCTKDYYNLMVCCQETYKPELLSGQFSHTVPSWLAFPTIPESWIMMLVVLVSYIFLFSFFPHCISFLKGAIAPLCIIVGRVLVEVGCKYFLRAYVHFPTFLWCLNSFLWECWSKLLKIIFWCRKSATSHVEPDGWFLFQALGIEVEWIHNHLCILEGLDRSLPYPTIANVPACVCVCLYSTSVCFWVHAQTGTHHITFWIPFLVLQEGNAVRRCEETFVCELG